MPPQWDWQKEMPQHRGCHLRCLFPARKGTAADARSTLGSGVVEWFAYCQNRHRLAWLASSVTGCGREMFHVAVEKENGLRKSGPESEEWDHRTDRTAGGKRRPQKVLSYRKHNGNLRGTACDGRLERGNAVVVLSHE